MTQWEYFLDESYYDMYAVRNIEDKSFNSSIHVNTEEEAKFLVDRLNYTEQLKEYIKECGMYCLDYLKEDKHEHM